MHLLFVGEWSGGEAEVGVMSDKVEGTRSCRSGVLREQIATDCHKQKWSAQ